MASATSERAWLPTLSAAALAAMAAFWLLATVSPAAGAGKPQLGFATSEQAVDALIAAVSSGSTAKLKQVLGPGSAPLVSSGDRVADKKAREKFLAAYRASNNLEKEGEDRATLVVGTDGWTFPFPLVKLDGAWHFDSHAGAEEILDRRIGANELNTIATCRAYVDAQQEYAEKDRNSDGFVEYAQHLLSSPGKRDGLYWPAAAGEEESPFGPLIADARAEGYGSSKRSGPSGPKPYHGYYYRILKGQGPAAPGGAYDYVVNGHLVGGFALVAFPARYGASGVMTFIVSHAGVVYQKDLGADTAEIAKKMTLFDPDPSWKPI